jgi:RHS repeat-associated protein
VSARIQCQVFHRPPRRLGSTAVRGRIRTPGVLEKVADNANAARVFWRIDTITAASVFDAKGNVIRSDLGNGLGTNHAFDPISGKAFNLRAGTSTGGFAGAQDQRYTYDLANNVATRTEAIRAVTETFGYDRLDRLTSYQTSSTSDAAANRSVSLDYNAIGNLLRKGDLGTYGYVAGRPHAVDVAAGTKYNYDANGSLSSTTGNQTRNITWTGFNQPEAMSYLAPGAATAATVAFTYDEDFQRIREVTTDGAKVRTVDMLHPDNQGGLGFEREQIQIGANAPTVENRHYISVSGVVIVVIKTQGDALPAAGTVPADANATNYWHKDSLGSIVAVSNATGSVLERMAFDAWGKRVRDTGLADPSVNPSNGDRGFTGHEHLDEMQLVHMNGRVYDPLLGKFLSVDPVVGNPNDLQTYNRYSYVYNQPTRYADATGNCPWCAFVFLVGAVMANEGNKYWSVVGKIMMIVAAPQMVEAGLGNASFLEAHAAAGGLESSVVASAFNVGGVGNSFLAAAGSSLAGGSSPEDAIRDGVFAIGFTSVGATYGGAGKSPQLLAAHAFLGCAQSAMSGGKCGPGAMAAVIGKGTTLGLDAGGITNPVAVGVATTIAGGTASVIGGGKFANGAFQASFAFIFNRCFSGPDCWRQAQIAFINSWKGFFVDPFLPDYSAVSGSVLSGQGGMSVNLRDGSTYAAAGVAMTDPRGTQWKPGASWTIGWIFGASRASDVNGFLAGSGNQVFLSVPTPVPANAYVAITHSFGGRTALELGAATPGPLSAGYSPVSHATKIEPKGP